MIKIPVTTISSRLAPLSQLLPAGRLLHEKEDILPYSFDGTAVLKAMPAVVVMAESVEEISAVLKFAQSERIPVVTRGSGTGLSGGSVPIQDGIVLCLARMNQLLEVDTRSGD